MGTTTTTFALNKPTVGGDDNAWGTDLNANADKLDDLLDGTTAIKPNLSEGLWKVGGVAVTATAAELNVLDGVTATTAEINILDGVTATAAELNILDGATLTVTELNYVDGVTSAIQGQLDAKQASGATLTSLEALSLVAGDVFYATAADTVARLGIGADGTVLTVVAGVPAWGGSSRTVLGPFATTSGSSVLVTGIPASTTTITVELHNGDLSASTGIWRLQIGPSGGVETSGYVGASTWFFGNATGSGTAFSSGFDLDPFEGTLPCSATWTMRNVAANTWQMHGSMTAAGAGTVVGNGRKTTADTVDRLSLLTPVGTLVAGEFYVICEV